MDKYEKKWCINFLSEETEQSKDEWEGTAENIGTFRIPFPYEINHC